LGKKRYTEIVLDLRRLMQNVSSFRGRLEILQERKGMFVFFLKTKQNNSNGDKRVNAGHFCTDFFVTFLIKVKNNFF